MQMVDEGKIALTPAVELSFLKKDEQENLFATMVPLQFTLQQFDDSVLHLLGRCPFREVFL